MKDSKRKEIKPRTHSATQDSVENDVEYAGQERVAEKLSISVPSQPLQRPTGIMNYFGQRVRLLLRDGSVVVGVLQKRLWNYVHLVDVEESGRGFTLRADWCDVELSTIARVYPATAKVEVVSKS
jgi:hypothetical protein